MHSSAGIQKNYSKISYSEKYEEDIKTITNTKNADALNIKKNFVLFLQSLKLIKF